MNLTSGGEKAALLLNSLPPEVAEGILAQLGPEQGGFMRAQMARFGIAPAPPEAVEQVLREFAELLRTTPIDSYEPAPAPTPGGPARPGAEPAGPAPAAENPPESGPDPADVLRRLPAEQLAAALAGESTPTVSLVLSCLEATHAGEVLKRLPPGLRSGVSVRLCRPLPADPDLLRTVAHAVAQKCASVRAGPAAQDDDAKARKLADMLRLLERSDRQEVLTALEQQNPDTAARVRGLLYSFEDILRIESRCVQKLLGEFDAKTLALALKPAPPEVRDRVMSNLSKRARETLTEEIEFLTAAPASQVRQAQKLVADAIQHLDEAGELVLIE